MAPPPKPPLRVDKEGNQLEILSKAEITAKEGHFDEDGFFILKDGSFYDPHGYYFDCDGLDAAGGSYDKEGYYISPTHYLEESQANDEDELED